MGFEPMFGTELEFYLMKETFAEAHAKNYANLTPSVPYILDYHVLATSYDEPFIRAVRKGMKEAGIKVESSKGEAWPGQQEINFHFADALTMADNHVIYKNGIKEMAQQHGCSVTFMAKPDHRWIGSSCHIHSSLWKGGRNTFDGESDTFKTYLAGHIAYAAEIAIFLAPNINSYKRYAAASWAPTTLAWGMTTAPVDFGSSATANTCARNRAFLAPTSTLTWRSRRSSPPDCAASKRSSSSDRRSPATRTNRMSSDSLTRCATQSPHSTRGRCCERLSAMTSSTTT
jgi:hypothetical protein